MPGFLEGTTQLHRAVDSTEADLHDFRSRGEEMIADGRILSARQLADRSLMEGISTYAALERMRYVNDTWLHKPWIAVMQVTALQSLEVEHDPDDTHHDLYGDRQTMLDSISEYMDAVG